jgi:hypothetical protein
LTASPIQAPFQPGRLAGQPPDQQGAEHQQGRRPSHGTGQLIAEGGQGLLDSQDQGEQPERGDQDIAQAFGEPVAEQRAGRRAGRDRGHVEQGAESSHRREVPFYVVE